MKQDKLSLTDFGYLRDIVGDFNDIGREVSDVTSVHLIAKAREKREHSDFFLLILASVLRQAGLKEVKR